MIEISAAMLRAIETHARKAFPEECCGLLLGAIANGLVRIAQAIPAENIAEPAQRTKRYIVEPLAILRADRLAREQGLEIVGAYHSHPNEPPVASHTDAQLAWEGYVYLIVSMRVESPCEVKAWRFVEETPQEETIHIYGD